MTVRELIAELIKFNPEASIQICDKDYPHCQYAYTVERILYNTCEADNVDPKDAKYVAFVPET